VLHGSLYLQSLYLHYLSHWYLWFYPALLLNVTLYAIMSLNMADYVQEIPYSS